ncbi:MAG TPA: hypothetical protein VNN08_18920 [Thermoanaerobaculia bacterium]|nr:hypothetical protein [Thermoanaerobaculia bacterium]
MTDTNTPPTSTTSPAVTAATATEAIAAQYRAALANLRSIMPGLLKYDKRQSRRIAASAKFGAQTIMPTATMVTTVEPEKNTVLFNVDAGQLAKAADDQLTPLAGQFAEFAVDLQFTIDTMLANVAVQALQVYRWAQHAVKQPGGEVLQPFVDQMSRAVKKTMNHRPRASAPAPAPTPGPATPASPAGAHGFLAPNLGAKKKDETEDVADRFEQALRDVTEE